MATHHGYPDPSHLQPPSAFHPFLQESRPAWPARMDFERTHQNIHAFGNHSTNLRDLSLQGTFESPRMTTGPEMMIDGVIPRTSPLIERDVSAPGLMNREPAIHHHDHTLSRAPRRSPPTWGPSRYRQQQSQRYRRYNHLSPSLRTPEPGYDPRREGANRDLAHNSRRSPDLRYPPSRNRPSPPLSSRWPSSVHELWNSTSFPNSRRYGPYPPPGNRRRRSSSDRRRRAPSPSQHHHRPEWEREQSSYQRRRQEPRERNANATPAINA